MTDPEDTPDSTRILVVADTHGHLDERIAALAGSADRVVHAGDVGGRSILERLGWLAGTVYAVHGNNDTARHWGDDDPDLAVELPAEVALDLPGGPLVVVHGHGVRARDRHSRLRRAYPDAGAVVYGHSHRVCIDRGDTPWILNPGAAGRTRTYGGPGCLVLHASPTQWSIEPHRFTPPERTRKSKVEPQHGHKINTKRPF